MEKRIVVFGSLTRVGNSFSVIETSLARQQTCTIADEEFWANRAIDNSTCGLQGTGDEAHQLQNRVKNELCAGAFLTSSPTVAPARVTQFTFRKLQETATEIRAELKLGARTTPPDRARFQDTVHTTHASSRSHRQDVMLLNRQTSTTSK